MDKYDLIISGGGMIGAIAANAALQSGLSVLLIEAGKLPTLSVDSERELRVSAISWHNLEYLKVLNIFNQLFNSRIHAYRNMKVWDNRSNACIEFETDDCKQQYLGSLIENNNLVQAAIKNLNKSDSCKIIQKNSVKSLENEGSQIRIELEGNILAKSKLLIAAEGRNSSIRDLVNINTKEVSYHQNGLVAYIHLENAPKRTALQAFNDGGPLGILPFGEGLFSIVWTLANDQVEHWLNCTVDEFEAGLQKAINKKFGEIKLIGSRAVFPLSSLNADKYFNNRVVLCGDTAHGVHPLAGQGVNLGIGDIQELFRNINKEIIKDDDLLFRALRKYQRRRVSKVTETSSMMTFINNLFIDDNHIKRPLRAIALNTLNKISIKNWFASQAGS